MSTVYERLPLPRYERPWEYLNRAICLVSDHQGPDVERLRVPLLPFTNLALAKEVLLRFSDRTGAADAPWDVTWEPLGGPFPSFRGRLSVETGEEPAIVLQGEYTPPLGNAGEAFDAVLGSRIASVTAMAFLKSLSSKMAAEARVDETVPPRTAP